MTDFATGEGTGLPIGTAGPPDARTPLFRDPDLERQLAETGTVELSIIADGDLDRLISGYWALAPQNDSGLAIDFMREDRRLVRELSDLVRSTFEPRLDDVLQDYQLVMTTFVVKHPGWESDMFLHDDRTFVDERVHRCVTIWTPLTAVGPSIPNGGLEVVAGSHRLPTGWAGSSTPELFRRYEGPLRSAAECRELAAGRSFAYDTRVLHASGPNLTVEPRLAAVVAVAPRSARLIHVVATGRRTRRVYEVDADFYTDHHPRDVEREMPDRYEAIAEYEAVPSLDAGDVSTLVGRPVVAGVDYLIPYDLRSPDDVAVLGTWGSVTKLEAPASLVPVDWDDLLDSANAGRRRSTRPPGGVAPLVGDSLVRALRRNFVPTAAATACDGLGIGRSAKDVDLVVLKPGARVRLTSAPRAGSVVEIRVVEAPDVGAGARTPESAAIFEQGTVIAAPFGEATVWNDGPGDLVVVVSRLVTLGRRGRRGTVPVST